MRRNCLKHSATTKPASRHSQLIAARVKSDKGLVHDLAPLQPGRTILHQGMAAERSNIGASGMRFEWGRTSDGPWSACTGKRHDGHQNLPPASGEPRAVRRDERDDRRRWGLLRDSTAMSLSAVPSSIDPAAVRDYLEHDRSCDDVSHGDARGTAGRCLSDGRSSPSGGGFRHSAYDFADRNRPGFKVRARAGACCLIKGALKLPDAQGSLAGR
jgi:hypothetical protein